MQGDDGWTRLMKRGLFEEAWQICDRSIRLRRGRPQHHRPRHLQNIWDGSALAQKRVLVRCYHGLGDTIQFTRYLPMVQRIAAETTVWIQPALLELVRPSLRGIRLLPLHDGSPDVPFDVDIEIMELAHAFRTTTATIPAPVLRRFPIVKPPFGVAVVGLQWRAGNWDRERSIPLPSIAPLLHLPGIRFVPLQERLTSSEQEYFTLPADTDIIGVARTIAGCDLVISVDTMAAHLAGTLRIPTWTLLKHDADWRWMSNRADSPWYPTMRLYRQPAPHSWDAVIAEVRAELCTSLAHRTSLAVEGVGEE
jgi:hypothetical protein